MLKLRGSITLPWLESKNSKKAFKISEKMSSSINHSTLTPRIRRLLKEIKAGRPFKQQSKKKWWTARLLKT
jgi:hypothetical protein